MDSEEQQENQEMEKKIRELSSDEASIMTEKSGPREEEMVMKEKELQSVSSKSMGDDVPLLPNAQSCEQPSPSERKTERITLEGGSPNASSQSLEEMEIKYAAYVRHDKYGTLGKGEVSLKEKVLLLFALIVVVPIRVVVCFLILLTYYLICRLCTLFKAPNREDEQEDYVHMSGIRRSIIVICGRFLSRAILFTLGFYWIKEKCAIPNQFPNGLFVKDGSQNDAEESSYRPGAIVSNHVSYLDILYHMSASFPSFVAKRSVARFPLVGLISKCLGCVYVQRESKASDFKGVSGVVTERLEAANHDKLSPMMMLFPEGTTTNGEFLLPFKTGAFLAKTPVLPVILRYRYQRFSPAWDTISGVRHVLLLLCQFVNYLEVTRLPVYCPSEKEKADPKLYANNVRKLMALEGNLTMSDIGLPEKRIYHAALHGDTLGKNLLVKG